MADEPRRSGRATKGQHKNTSPSPAPPSKALKSSKGRTPKKSAEAQQADQEDDEVIRCICGNDNPKDKRAFIGCDACTVWQHNICMGIAEYADDVPDHYFCEQCKPDEHPETVEALARGDKIWETRNKIWQSEKKMSKNRKNKSRGEDGKPGWLKKDTYSEPTAQSPAPESGAEPTSTNGSSNDNSNKRKREDIKEESEGQPQATLEEAPGRSGRQDKRRKSAAATAKTAVSEDPNTALVNISGLPKDRIGPAQALNKTITAVVQERVAEGAHLPDGQTASLVGEHHAARIEYALHMNHGAGTTAYKNQFRALNANLSKNKVLVERLMSGDLTADELSTMSSGDMASEEQQRERAAIKEALDRQATVSQTEGPQYKQDHKGFHLIEDSSQSEKVADTQPAPTGQVSSPQRLKKSESPPAAPALPSTETPVQSDIGQERRPSSQQFDMKDIWAKTAQSPTNTTAPRPSQQPLRKPSSAHASPNQPNGQQDDPDIDRMLEDNDEVYSPAAAVGDDVVVWRGELVQGISEPAPTVNARFVAGRDLSSTISWQQLLPEKLSIDGRLSIQKAEEYLCNLQWSTTSDVAVLALRPYDNAEAFDMVFKYFKSRQRYAVVEKSKPAMVKDLYIIPLEAGGDLPEHVNMLEHCTIKKPVEDKVLLATLVVARAPDSPTAPQDATPSQRPPQANGQIPSHVRHSISAPAGSPLNTQNPTFSPSHPAAPQTAGFIPAAHSQSSIPPNPYSSQPSHPQQQIYHPPPPLQQQQQQGGLPAIPQHPDPLVNQVLGNLQYTPTAQQILHHGGKVSFEQLNNLRLILTEDPITQTNMEALTKKLYSER